MAVDAKYYCNTMNAELTGLKARIYNIVRELERMPDSEGMEDQLFGLYDLVDELTGKIDDLNRECPADWSAHKQEIDQIKRQLSEKIDLWDAEHIAGGYVGG